MTSLQATAMGGGAASTKTANYVLVAADAGTTVAMNAAGATTITVNTGLFAAGDTVFIQNIGAGVCTITAGTATVNTAGALALPQYDAGILYFTSTSAAIFYDYIQVGAASPLTTKGDLYTFSTSDTRLGVGANNTVLTADSAEATGLKWAAAAGGSMTEITSGSAPTGANNFTISSIPSGYRDLRMEFYDVRPGNDDNIHCRINGATGSVYFDSGGPMGNNMTVGTLLRFQGYSDNTATGGLTVGVFFDYLGNHWKMMQTIGIFPNPTTTTNANGNFYCGGSNQTAAITSLNFYTEGGSNFTGGTYALYGVK